ncbi:hypothetical protein RHGRI_000386 [Rhododendron griersonianum]|uniref:Cation-transporting P-type ATPase N-terminal domain-containing protein n=1 Tax=Rhododendron griersonianum TaxID=479676 RepID=A0AAV6LJ96_9ERIC|nr:hypothetical protein RHGRI_000386 [Rhododendron griersonianum]
MIAEEKTSRVAPNGRNKRRRVSTIQTVIKGVPNSRSKRRRVSTNQTENIPIMEVFKQLKCTREGLSTEKGEKRLQIFGFNKLEEKKANFLTPLCLRFLYF